MKSLRGKLLLAIGICLLITQSISIVWVWHESQEQIQLLVEKALDSDARDVAEIEAEVEEEIRETMAALFLPALLAIFVAIFFIFVAVSRLTRPLRELAKEVEARTPYNLQPLNVHHTSSEVMVVETALNQLLQRLDQGLENERHFTADVAHELRTPLAGIRLSLELMQQKNIADVDPLIARIDLMMVSIERLLQLSRAGHKLSKGIGERVELVSEVIEPTQMEWDDDPTGATIVWETPPQLCIVGDSGLIYLMLRNLLENVRCHAPDAKHVTVLLAQQGEQVVLEVLDEGTGVPEENLSSLTQRFTRLDKTQKGFGLGLNIVNRIVQIHQGTLEIQNRSDRSGLHVIVKFPQA